MGPAHLTRANPGNKARAGPEPAAPRRQSIATTEIWTLPPSSADDGNLALADTSRPDQGRVFYIKSTVDAVHLLDPAAKQVLQWPLTEALTPPSVAKGEAAGTARIALTPARKTPKLWVVLKGWKALAELDPVINQVRIFSADPPDAEPDSRGHPFSSTRAVLPESATRIWFAGRDYARKVPLLGLLDTAAGRAHYWTLGGPATDASVEDLTLGADGRLWFACRANADSGEEVAFLGVLEPATRRVRYWLTGGIAPEWPDRMVGVQRLGARKRSAATAIWLVLRNHYGSSVFKVDTASEAFSYAGGSNLNEGRFSIAFPRVNEAAVGYRDFVRIHKDRSGCLAPALMPTSTAIVGTGTRAVRMAAHKIEPVRAKVTRRTVNTTVLDQTCLRDLTPDSPSIGDMLHADTGGRLWLGRETGYEIGLFTP